MQVSIDVFSWKLGTFTDSTFPLPPHTCSSCIFYVSQYTGWSKVTVTNNISMTNLKNTKNGLTQWFLESIYAAVLVFWCLKIIRWKKILHFSVVPKWWVCSARLNSAWTEASSNPQSSFDIPKYHPDTPSLSLRHPKTSPQHQTL